MKFRYILLFTPFIVLALFLFSSSPASAATFTVNSTLDTSDVNLGDGVCGTGSGVCTLRAAIEEGNAFLGADSVFFNIGGGGVQTIAPNTAFPMIVGTLMIDGTSQPGYTNNPLIVVTGGNISGWVHGFEFDVSNGNGVKGLCINSFSDYALVFRDSTDNNIIENNFLLPYLICISQYYLRIKWINKSFIINRNSY